MVRIIDYQKRQNKDGEDFFFQVLQGGLQIVRAEEAGKYYLTMKQAPISTTFYEATCKSLIVEAIHGSIVKVEYEPFEYAKPDTSEVITLSHRWKYVRESDTLREIVFYGKPEDALAM